MSFDILGIYCDILDMCMHKYINIHIYIHTREGTHTQTDTLALLAHIYSSSNSSSWAAAAAAHLQWRWWQAGSSSSKMSEYILLHNKGIISYVEKGKSVIVYLIHLRETTYTWYLIETQLNTSLKDVIRICWKMLISKFCMAQRNFMYLILVLENTYYKLATSISPITQLSQVWIVISGLHEFEGHLNNGRRWWSSIIFCQEGCRVTLATSS